MSRRIHFIYISLMSIIVISVLLLLLIDGYSYYNVELEERFFHEDHTLLKPSGSIGHGIGIFGSVFMILGVSLYMLRKRWKSMARLGLLKHWLEFHIFLCTLGPILILFHTSFKFGGIVSVSFWSMVAVFLSGIVGRFIYIQIPRTIEGREMSLNDIRIRRSKIRDNIERVYKDDFDRIENLKKVISADENALFETLKNVRKLLKETRISKIEKRKIIALIKEDLKLKSRIRRLTRMQNLFKFWHVAHLPFALIMLIIMIVHIVVTIVFGYRWIF